VAAKNNYSLKFPMKKLKLYFVLVSFFIQQSFVIAQQEDWKKFTTGKNQNFEAVCREIENYFLAHPEKKISENKKEGSAYTAFLQWKYFWKNRLTEDGNFPDAGVVQGAFVEEQLKKQLIISQDSISCPWTYIDQTVNSGGYWGMGRTTSAAFHPTNPNTFYVAAAAGGIWKTTNNGQSYTAMDEGLPYGAASNLLMDPNNPDILYVSNGDHVGWWTYSSGVYKSTDGGANWLPTGLVFNLGNTAIYKMQMDPLNSQIIYAATSDGLYKTVNGGNNWNVVRTGSHSDVKFKPGNSNIIYTATDDYWGSSEIYKSSNGGQSWSQITNLNTNYNFLKLLTTPLDNQRIGYLCSQPDQTFFESTDEGNNFVFRSVLPEGNLIGYAPNNPQQLYCGFMKVFKSTDSGVNWTQITDWYNTGVLPEIHADQREIVYTSNNQEIVFCNDGGLYRYNVANDFWTDFSNGLLIGQFYRIANSSTHPLLMIGGTQDNGGRKRTQAGNWENANGGDGMEVAIEPGNDNVYYTTYIFGTGWNRTTNNGANWTDIQQNIPGQPEGQWVTPYDLDPNNPQTIVAGYDQVWRSTNRGDTWTAISNDLSGNGEDLTDLEIAPSNSNVIYAALNTKVFVTQDLGANWLAYTLPGTAPITRITIHPTNPGIAWVTRGGYSNNMKVYKTVNFGAGWTNYSTGLPNVPSNCIIYQNGTNDRLFVANDLGVYYRDADMNSWETFGIDLPSTLANDLKIHYPSSKLRVGTFGRGIWEVDLCPQQTQSKKEFIQDHLLMIYPNPSTGSILIKNKNITLIESIELTNLDGKKISFNQIIENEFSRRIEIEGAAGVYILSILQGGEVRHYRVMKR
jgi:photosystem II stability/assembly factor-like uncharacterized protein